MVPPGGPWVLQLRLENLYLPSSCMITLVLDQSLGAGMPGLSFLSILSVSLKKSFVSSKGLLVLKISSNIEDLFSSSNGIVLSRTLLVPSFFVLPVPESCSCVVAGRAIVFFTPDPFELGVVFTSINFPGVDLTSSYTGTVEEA